MDYKPRAGAIQQRDFYWPILGLQIDIDMQSWLGEVVCGRVSSSCLELPVCLWWSPARLPAEPEVEPVVAGPWFY